MMSSVLFCPDCPAPATRRLKMKDVSKGKTPDLDLLLLHFTREGRVDPDVAIRICVEATALLRSEPNIVEVPAPVVSLLMM
jgi:serine/threonine-protein phosphatase 2B catalytic subunit